MPKAAKKPKRAKAKPQADYDPDTGFVDPSIWAGAPEAKVVDEVRWVYNNMANRAPNPAEAPSMGAWGMLWTCRQSQQDRIKFIEVWKQLLPSNRQLELEERYQDDGRRVTKFIDHLKRVGVVDADLAVYPPDPEDAPCKPGPAPRTFEDGAQPEAG